MDAIRRTSTLRRVATTASLATLLIPAAAADAKPKKAKEPKPPVITSVTPLKAEVGDKLTIKGRNFRKGRGKNAVGFKRDGEPVVFLRSSLSTERTMIVPLTDKLGKVLDGAPARFSLRVLTTTFGKQYTAPGLSPMIAPRAKDPSEPGPDATPTPTPTASPTPAPPACAAGTSESTDFDGDGLSDALENRIGTGGCLADTDKDGVPDGYEYRSAIDLNDDEYQNPDTVLPYPAADAYPNPLNKDGEGDNAVDYDGDGLSLEQEYKLWTSTTAPAQRTLADPAPDANGRLAATPLNYSDGLQYSRARRCRAGDQSPLCGPNHVNRRVPDLAAAGYDRWNGFLTWADTAGYDTVALHLRTAWYGHQTGRQDFSILDVDLSGTVAPGEQFPLDRDNDTFLSDDERDEDADGLSNLTESRVQMRPGYWASCYDQETPFTVAYGGTDAANPDTDGDGVRDGADDQDRDDFPNMMELSRIEASGFDDTEDYQAGSATGDGSGPRCKPDADLLQVNDDPDTPQDESLQPYPLNHPNAYGQVNPFNPCLPDTGARSCPTFFEFGTAPAPFDESPHWWALQ